MKTKLLFLENAYTTACQATVRSCEAAGDGFRVVVDQTPFFPSGGGQPGDVGKLGDAKVFDVVEDGEVYHLTDRPLPVGEEVMAEIDWDIRLTRMQNHTGEHLLCGIAHTLYGCENVGFHLTDECVVFDLSKPLTEAQVEELQTRAMEAVYENREIFAKSAGVVGEYRSKLDADDSLRIVVIEGYDKCACCAPHVKRTGEIGPIRILDAVPHRGGTRLTLVCGKTAYEDFRKIDGMTHELMKRLSSPRYGVCEAAEKLADERDTLRKTVAELSGKLALSTLTVETVGDVAFGCLDAGDFDTLRACANAREEALLLLLTGDGTFVVRGHGAKELGAKLTATFSGRGGGKPDFVQGKLTATYEEIKEFLKKR